jgi:bifunctional UDP-N-acetylglucosamine pyrophosphorylase / glucosamine-1-phosphate N-acetyltransferase
VEGVNTRAELADAAAFLRARVNREHMLAGVTIVDPQTTWIDPDVELDPDSTIHPFTVLRGHTRVATGAEVGPHVVAVDAEIGPDAKVGPFCYLRPGTRLGAGAKAGTFVEIKNSEIGAGAKVPHLSYIGDAEVGEGSNLGASTVTANYDGFRKHRTKIGKNVHTGVDTTFVAPVEVGDEAYTGAGSVITEDVPPGALGIERAEQKNVEGYAEEKAEESRAKEEDS